MYRKERLRREQRKNKIRICRQGMRLNCRMSCFHAHMDCALLGKPVTCKCSCRMSCQENAKIIVLQN